MKIGGKDYIGVKNIWQWKRNTLAKYFNSVISMTEQMDIFLKTKDTNDINDTICKLYLYKKLVE